MSPRVPELQRSLSSKARWFLLVLPRKETLVLALLLVVATFGVYYRVHNYGFLDYDDAKYITENPHIHNGLDAETVFWAFTHGYAANYHPLTWMSHALDIDLFALDAGGPHLENVTLHVINALLLFWVLLRATGYIGRSWMVAALFALHPINVESVAWVAERKTMLSTLFFLLALGAYRWYVSKTEVRRYALVACLFVLGLMAKPQVIMFPLVLLLWDFWPLGRIVLPGEVAPEGPESVSSYRKKSFSSLLKEKIPLFAICLVDAAATMVAQGAAGGTQPYSLSVRLQNAVVAYVRYIGKAFWPLNLAIMYPHPGNSLPTWEVLAAFLFLAAVSVSVAWARRQPYLSVGWLWFLITLVPMIGLVQVDVQAMADRYAYISFIGLFLMVCWGVARWVEQHDLPGMLLPALSLIVLLALTAVTYRQVNYWRDDLTLWRRSLQISPRHNWKGEYFLGAALQKQGTTEEGMQHYFRAEEMFRGDPYLNLSIAVYEHKKRNLPLAIEYYKRALATSQNPQVKVQVLTEMGRAYADLGDLKQAQQCMTSSSNTAHAQKVNWQGEWWKQLGPAIQAWMARHFGSSKHR